MATRSAVARCLGILAMSVWPLCGQTTQGLIRGRVRDLSNDVGLGSCGVALTGRYTGEKRSVVTDAAGDYVIGPLSPGSYDLRIDCPRYQGQESHNIQLPVAASLLINSRVRPLSEVWEDNYRKLQVMPNATVLTLYGPDLDLSHSAVVQPLRGLPSALESTVSQVIDREPLNNLPLSGRDAYTLLILQPGATSDASVSRSLGLSINGQRPSASKFLLDGLENDDPLITGPLSPIAPEALEEYRISSNSFTAEYGGASGYVANAVTRSGTLGFHGLGYVYVRNDRLNARSPGVQGADPGAPFSELQEGAVASGPIWKRRKVLGSVSWETAALSTRQPAQDFTVPTANWLASLNPNTLAARWLQGRALSQASSQLSGPGDIATLRIAPPLNVDRTMVVPRIDKQFDSSHLSIRYAGLFTDRSDFLYNPYPDFSLGVSQNRHSVAASWTASFGNRLTLESRFGYNVSSFAAERPHPEVPVLVVESTPELPLGLTLPASQATYSFSNRTRTVEFDENVGLYRGRHVIRAGGGIILRGVSGQLASVASGQFTFSDLGAFGRDAPDSVLASVSRVAATANPSGPAVLPDFNRIYSLKDWYAFAQDSYRVSERLTLSAGLRFDWFGAPVNTGTSKDVLISVPGEGALTTRLMNTPLGTSSGDQSLYQVRHNGLAFRGGVSYAFNRDATTVFRGAFGTYCDRPFDNIWQTIRNNSYLTASGSLDPTSRNYANLAQVLGTFPSLPVAPTFTDLTTFAPNLSTPRVMSWMAGLQHAFSRRWVVDAAYLGSASGSLIDTDRLNRQGSIPSVSGNSGGRYEPNLPDIIYRSTLGSSDYSALSLHTRYASHRVSATASYTLSRSRDNQSDPISGEFFDLGFGGGGLTPTATFIKQGDASADWGHSAFDRRHNLVVSGLWTVPVWLGGVQLSALAAARSGSPFTVLSPFAETALLDNPADLVPGKPIWLGQQLNPAAFAPAGDHVGTSGRNHFYGPNSLSADTSIARRFHVKRMPEKSNLLLRADIYNVFNHGNLTLTNNNLGSPGFGLLVRSPQIAPNPFRIFGPLGDTGRQIQLMFRAEF